MSTAIRLGALAMAALVALSFAAPAVASGPADIEFSAGNTSFTVTVTHNGTPVNDTLVNVTPTDPANVSYTGDSGLTDVNGTVTFDLPANETEVAISTTYNGSESSITRTLHAYGTTEPTWDGEGPFGQWLTGIIRNLVPADGQPLGQLVSEIVTSNNPGSEHRSDKANPGGNSTGPPEHAVNKSNGKGNGSQGPPDHAKNASKDKGNSSATDNGNGGNGNSGQGNGNGQGNGGNGNGGNGQGNDGSLARPAF